MDTIRLLAAGPRQRLLLSVVLALALLLPSSRPVLAVGVPDLLSFEDLPAGSTVFNQYPGVTFIGGDGSNFDGSHTVTIVQPAQGTESPSRALQTHFVYSGCEFCGTVMTMSFDQPQGHVGLSTGLADACPGCGFNQGLTIWLQAFDTDPAQPGATQIDQQVMPCPQATDTTPITTPMQANDVLSRIHYVQLAEVSCSSPQTINSGPNGGNIQIDNLVFDRPLNPPVREHNPPIITITDPANSATVVGATPNTISLVLHATVAESALASLTAQVNGHTPVLVTYVQNVALQMYDAYILLSDQQGLVAGTNTVVLMATDFDQPQNTATASVTFTYQVKPPPPPSTTDIWPTAFEILQSIDLGPHSLTGSDLKQGGGYIVQGPYSTPLVQGKPTVVRVFAAAAGTTAVVNGVPAVMDIRKANCSTNCTIVTGMAPILSPTVPNTFGINVAPFGAPQSLVGNEALSLSSTWNFLIPADWTNQDIVATVNVNDGAYTRFPTRSRTEECVSPAPTLCYNNDSVELHLHFQTAKQIVIDPVFIHVTGTYKGKTFTDVQPTQTQVDTFIQTFNQLYPEIVTQGRRLDVTVGPGDSKDDILDRVKDQRSDSMADNEMVLGVFPGNQGDFAANEVGGYGSVGTGGPFGTPGAFAQAADPVAAVHEIGHNIGFDHWACENGVTDDECGVFPIPHGGIGAIGMDIVNWALVPPGDNSSNTTPHAHDFMSYGRQCSCNTREWVSWYTYGILVDHGTLDSYDTDDPPAILLSGRISPQGAATFRPAYRASVNHALIDTIVEDDPTAIYTAEGFDAQGNALFVHNFEPQKLDVHTADYGKALIFDTAVPDLPGLRQVAIYKDTAVLGTLSVTPNTPTVQIATPATGTVWPVGTPQTIRWTTTSPSGAPLTALVQYSPDGGTTRITLGRDVTGTTLVINPDSLSGSTNAFVYVQVSDGLNTATAQAGPFTVAPKPPTVHIVTPHAAAQVEAGMPLTLQGSAFDRQENLVDGQFTWSSSRDGALGSGRQLTVSQLSVGQHTLTLTVTDSHGRSGQATVQLLVKPTPWVMLPVTIR